MSTESLDRFVKPPHMNRERRLDVAMAAHWIALGLHDVPRNDPMSIDRHLVAIRAAEAPHGNSKFALMGAVLLGNQVTIEMHRSPDLSRPPKGWEKTWCGTARLALSGGSFRRNDGERADFDTALVSPSLWLSSRLLKVLESAQAWLTEKEPGPGTDPRYDETATELLGGFNDSGHRFTMPPLQKAMSMILESPELFSD